jgi:hypothetical protein
MENPTNEMQNISPSKFFMEIAFSCVLVFFNVTIDKNVER